MPGRLAVHSPGELGSQSLREDSLDGAFNLLAPGDGDARIHVIDFTSAKSNSLVVLLVLDFGLLLADGDLQFRYFILALGESLGHASSGLDLELLVLLELFKPLLKVL